MQRNKRLELVMGGTSRPLLFDFAFLDFLTETITLTEIEELGYTKPWRVIPILATAALKSGADFEGQKDKFEIKTVTRWVEDLSPVDAGKIMEGFKDTMGFTMAQISGKSEVPAENPAP